MNLKKKSLRFGIAVWWWLRSSEYLDKQDPEGFLGYVSYVATDHNDIRSPASFHVHDIIANFVI